MSCKVKARIRRVFFTGGVFVWHEGSEEDSWEKIHTIRTTDSRALVQDPVAAAVGLVTFPYLFAFGAADGTVKIWSVLSNNDLGFNGSTFRVQDEREGWKGTDLMGKFLILPPPDLDIAQEEAPGSSRKR